MELLGEVMNETQAYFQTGDNFFNSRKVWQREKKLVVSSLCDLVTQLN
jgi:hypothetical protein